MILSFLGKVLFTVFSVTIAIVDFKFGVVPRAAFLFTLPVFFALNLLQSGFYALYMSFIGIFLGLFVFTLAYFISGRRLGKADIWYSALIGLVLGPVWWYPAIGIACIAGVVWLVFFRKNRIPFIPCMAIGGISMSFLQGLFK